MPKPKPKPPQRTDLPIRTFASQAAWEKWLEQHHEKSEGLWLKMAKQSTGIPSVNYQEALEVALCFGWIDGLKSAFDATWWMQRFTPRRPRSKWSKINCGKIEQLLEQKKLRPAGLREVAAAKGDGRWEAAYLGQSAATLPPDFAKLLEQRPKARAAWDELSSANRYSVIYWLHDAKKEETRQRRIQQFLTRLESGKPFR